MRTTLCMKMSPVWFYTLYIYPSSVLRLMLSQLSCLARSLNKLTLGSQHAQPKPRGLAFIHIPFSFIPEAGRHSNYFSSLRSYQTFFYAREMGLAVHTRFKLVLLQEKQSCPRVTTHATYGVFPRCRKS